MDYVKYLRSMVGNKPIILTGSSVVIINEKNQILLQLRKDNHLWGLPGGAMNLGESFEEVAIRETFEETGLQVEELKLLNLFSGKNLHYIYPNGDEVYSVIALYECKQYSGKLSADMEESEEVKFFNLDELPKNIAPPLEIKEFLNRYYLKK